MNLSSLVHPYFKNVDQHGKAGCQDKIHSGYDEPDFESHICVRYEVKSFGRQFGNGDNADNGRMFDQGNKQASQWW